MNILVLNAGSSSHKLCLYHLPDSGQMLLPDYPSKPAWRGQLDWHPEQNSVLLEATAGDRTESETLSEMSRSEALLRLLTTLWQGPTGVIQHLAEIDAVGHRVVHGGARYQQPVLITQTVKQAIADLIPLAPVHNPANLEGIELMERLFLEQQLGELDEQRSRERSGQQSKQSLDIPQVAVFDTAFHHTLPEVAFTYPGPYDWQKQNIRRYGFHGISHQYCAQRAAQLLQQDLTQLRLIICHLGNGGSLTAVKNGQSIDTTMGFTPLDGLMMGTRSGAVDPGILIHLLRQGLSVEALDHQLNQASGLKGISGISHDLRELRKAIATGHKRAELAIALYLHRLKACLGSMLMSLGGLDVLVFTAGIGEHHTAIRAAAGEALAFLGVEIDAESNQNNPVDVDIASARSTARVLVIQTQEDWAIAQQVFATLTA